jgi:hypothetical protein
VRPDRLMKNPREGPIVGFGPHGPRSAFSPGYGPGTREAPRFGSHARRVASKA